MTLDEDRPPVDPAESLRLIEREQAQAGRSLVPDPRLLHWPWGVAWLIGFTLFFLRYGPDGRVFVDLPDWLPLATLLALLAVAGVLTAVAGVRAGRHVSGPSARQGIMYGLSWCVGFFGITVALSRVTEVLTDAQANLLWAGAVVALVGALHIAGGAIWNDWHLFTIGLVISVANIAGLFIGAGWHTLILAIAGGGGMLLTGTLSWLRWRR